jgi:hypothetical protein
MHFAKPVLSYIARGIFISLSIKSEKYLLPYRRLKMSQERENEEKVC